MNAACQRWRQMVCSAAVFLGSTSLLAATGAPAQAQQSLCPAAPLIDCRVASRSSFLARVSPAYPERDRIIWRWREGQGTAVTAFGDPSVATSYSVCVYDTSDGDTHLSLVLDIPAGGSWKSRGKKRLRYRGKRMQVKLKAGAARKARISFAAHGPALSMPRAATPNSMFYHNPLVSIQLVNSEGSCWGAGYEAPALRNRPRRFVTKTSRSHNGACIGSGDQDDILKVLTGPGAEAVLCPGALFDLTSPIEFTAKDQSVHTAGLPTDDSRAVLRVAGDSLATAVDGMWLDGVQLRSVIVDGGRRRLGMVPDGTALLNFGYNSTGQVIESVKAVDPRGWVAIYASGGGDPRCSGIEIRNNVVQTAGSLYSRADGISIGCPDSIVEGNTVIDATDGAFVIFQAPGSIIRDNTVRAETLSASYGISMIDWLPFDGDFTGTQILNNTIDAAGAVIKTGIAMGDAPGCPSDIRSRGAVVRGNVLRGSHMGYGFPVMGVEDWTVMDNVDLSTHEPAVREAAGCMDTPQPAAAGFQIDLSRSSGTFQSEYQSADLGLLLQAYSEPFSFSESCLAGFIGTDALQEIKNGDRGSIALALEQAPGGFFLEQCVEKISIPPMASDAIVTITARACTPTCVILELQNTGTEPIDLADTLFLVEGFRVDCAGLPDAVASNGAVTCRIDDFVTTDTGGSLLEVYGIMARPRVMFIGPPFD